MANQDEKQEKMVKALIWLQIAIDQAGGQIILENLERYKGVSMALSIQEDRDNDRIILTAKRGRHYTIATNN